MPWDIKQKSIVITFPDGDHTTFTTDFLLDSYQKTEVYHNNLRGADNSLRLTVPFHEDFSDKLKQYVNKDIKAHVINKDNTVDFAGYLRKNFKIEKQKRPQPIALEIVSPSFLLKKSIGRGNALSLKEKTVTQICNALLEKAGFTNNSEITISNIIPLFTAEEDEQYYAILSDILFEYGYTFDFDTSGAFVILPLFNMPVGTPSQVFNKNNIRSKLEQKIEEQKNSSNITLEWSTLTKFERVTLYENTEGRNAVYPDGCKLDVYPGKYLFNNEINRITYDSSLGEVVWVDAIYQDFRAPHPLAVELCENLGKSVNLSIKNTGAVTAYVTKLRIKGDAYIKVEGQRTRSPGSGDEKTYELKYNHDSAVISQITKHIAEYNLYSGLKISLQSEDDYTVGSFVAIVEAYMGTVIGRIVKKTTVLRDFFKYEIESITEYDPVEDLEILNKPSGKMASLLAVPPDITAPTPPVITTIAALPGGEIEVTFAASVDNESGVYFYNIYRCQAETETGIKDTPVVVYTVPHDGSANYTFVDHNTENRAWYFYTISAVDKANNESVKSAEGKKQARVSATPKSPYLIKAEAISDGVSISIFLYGSTSVFENSITAPAFFRLRMSMDGGNTWTDVARFQGNSYLWRWPDTFPINGASIGNLKFGAYSSNVYNCEDPAEIKMMNRKVKFDAGLFPPPYQPEIELFTQLSSLSQSTPGTKTVTLRKGWYKIILKGGGGGGSGKGGGGGGSKYDGTFSIPFASWNIGSDGGNGRDGEDGKNGGDSIVIIKKSNTTITAKGGLGGNGGKGGSGGDIDDGYHGESGDDGQAGTDGQNGGYVEKVIWVGESSEIILVAGAAGSAGKGGSGGAKG